jgi:hypothetical protein
MCDRCDELDEQIVRCRRVIARHDDDARLSAGLGQLIKEAEAEKVTIHRKRT